MNTNLTTTNKDSKALITRAKSLIGITNKILERKDDENHFRK